MSCSEKQNAAQAGVTKTQIIDQPEFEFWVDARHAMTDLAGQHGYAVLVASDKGFRVIPGKDVEECMDLAGENEILEEAARP